jgi:hypothetical protein
MEEAERVGDEAALHHRLERHQLPEMREGIAHGIGVVLHRDLGHLLEAEPAAVHGRPGDEPGEGGHGRPVGALVRIHGAPDDLRDARRGHVAHLLAADHQHAPMDSRRHRGEGCVDRGHPRRGGRLHAQGGHVGEAEVSVDEGGVVARSRELFRIHGRDHERVGALDAGVGEGGQARLRDQVGQAFVTPAKPGHPYPGYPDVAHGLISNRQRGRCQTLWDGGGGSPRGREAPFSPGA